MIFQKRVRWLIAITQFITCGLIAGCGTLGAIGDGIYFPTSKKKLEIAMDSLYSEHPEYKIPAKWNKYNDWSKAGYDFLESRIFYFKSDPEEMYYITFIGDSVALADTSKIAIGIRAVFNEKNIAGKWWLAADDLKSKDKERIEKRFDAEIISKLELYTKKKASKKSL